MADLGKPPRLAVQGLEGDRRTERQPDQERPADVQVVDQSEQVVHEMVVGDPAQAGTVVGVLAGIVVEDGPEPLRRAG